MARTVADIPIGTACRMLRTTLASRILALFVGMVSTPVAASPTDNFLDGTALIQSNPPEVRAKAGQITRGASTNRAKAIRIHDYVRDEIAFGWTDSFYRMSAIDVLKAKVGYCNTKGTLFIALLRAAGIPARQRFVAIPSDVLSGLVDPGTPKVDHSYSEVWLDDRWVRVDSYIVDRPLFIQAQKALAASGRSVGFGIRLGGLTDWNGIDDSFLQFARDDNDTDTEHYGVFLDVEDYYQQVDGWNELSGLRSLLIPLFIGQATSQVESLREGTRSDSSD